MTPALDTVRPVATPEGLSPTWIVSVLLGPPLPIATTTTTITAATTTAMGTSSLGLNIRLRGVSVDIAGA